jgi:hypothetical protein
MAYLYLLVTQERNEGALARTCHSHDSDYDVVFAICMVQVGSKLSSRASAYLKFTFSIA